MHSFSFPRRVVPHAVQVERWGFDGLMLADSQNLNADIWVELGMAAAATERIKLGPGVTNPATRHPAVTASAAATLQAETGGRAVLGIGRGDSALTQIGRRPVPVAELERAVVAIQCYLSGKEVDSEGVRSRIGWIPSAQDLPKVPVRVAASGPRVIAMAAEHADGIDLTVGAEEERLRWALQMAQPSGDAASSVGAFLNVAVHPDRGVA
nr:LLM class flavin-dependent oxidoreductase [Solirubrobacterales bacterium]